MSFVHDDPDFDGLLQIVANSRGLGVALVEKGLLGAFVPTRDEALVPACARVDALLAAQEPCCTSSD